MASPLVFVPRVTPGTSVANWVKLRAFSGKSTTWRPWITSAMLEVAVSTGGASEDTCTVSDVVPALKATFNGSTWLTSRVTFWVRVLKFGAFTSTV